MKIKVMFTVQGEGRGHMTQALSLKKALEQNGFEICGVIVGASGRRVVPAFFIEKFSGIPVEKVTSPNFITKNNRGIKIGATMRHNFLRTRTYLKSATFMRRKIEEWRPNVIVNFYEPITGLYAKLNSSRPPIVSIAHQYLGAHPGFRYPPGHKLDRYFLESYTRFTAAGSDRILALSFYPLENEPGKKLKVVPPLLRNDVKELSITNRDYFLCYLVNPGYRSDVERWHAENSSAEFHIFTDLKSEKDVVQVNEKLFFHRLSDKNFLEHMAGCKGLITSAGFESVCEALYLGKPVFMVPVEGHFEQLCNAHDGMRAGAGIFSEKFDIGKFMKWLPSFQSQSPIFREWESKAENLFVKHIREVAATRAALQIHSAEAVPA